MRWSVDSRRRRSLMSTADGADEPHPGLGLEREADDEPVSWSGRSRKGLLDLEHRARREHHLVVAAHALGARGRKPLVVPLAEERVSSAAKTFAKARL